jgi:hypothetical protein
LGLDIDITTLNGKYQHITECRNFFGLGSLFVLLIQYYGIENLQINSMGRSEYRTPDLRRVEPYGKPAWKDNTVT